jgi:hypothetical protein
MTINFCCFTIKKIIQLQIGLMRDGTLLAEESPNQLLIKHNCSTLEQAFLDLSKRQTRSSIMDREDENCVRSN